VFRTGNIRRLEPRYHIPAVLNQANLDAAIQASELSAQELPSNVNPDINPPALRSLSIHPEVRIISTEFIVAILRKKYLYSLGSGHTVPGPYNQHFSVQRSISLKANALCTHRSDCVSNRHQAKTNFGLPNLAACPS
jgi:hypothetical protein